MYCTVYSVHRTVCWEMDSFIIIFYMIIFVVICWCHALLAPCTVTAMTSGGKGHLAKCLPYQLRIVLSLQSQFVLKSKWNAQYFCIAQTTVYHLYFVYILSIIHSFHFYCLFDYAFEFFNSGRFFVNLFNSKGDLSLTKIFKPFQFGFEYKCYMKMCVNIVTI